MDLNSTQVNFSFLQKPEAGPLWPSLEVAHISARSCRFSLSRAHSWAGAWEMELLLWKWAQRMRGCLTAPLPQDWRPCPQLLGILAADNTQVSLCDHCTEAPGPISLKIAPLVAGGHFENNWLMQAENVLSLWPPSATTPKGHLSSRGPCGGSTGAWLNKHRGRPCPPHFLQVAFRRALPTSPSLQLSTPETFQGTHTRNLGSEPEKRWKHAGTRYPRGLLQPHLSHRL